MSDLARYVAASRRRLELARGIANGLRHEEELHRAAMMAVFALEDCHEALARAQAIEICSDPPRPLNGDGRAPALRGAPRGGVGGRVVDPS